MSDFLVIANFKQGGDWRYVKALLGDLEQDFATGGSGVQVVLLPPVPYLTKLVSGINAASIAAGVQVVSGLADGAWTGSYSAAMVAELGARYACVGHSERRIKFNDDDALVAAQYVQIVQAGMVPILCLGETLQQRERGETIQVLQRQLSSVFLFPGFQKLPKHDIIVAYEPVWAIGAGQAASLHEVEPVINDIRSIVSQCHAVAKCQVCYGGSVDEATCAQFLSFVDGLLVGRASLNRRQLQGVIKQCSG